MTGVLFVELQVQAVRNACRKAKINQSTGRTTKRGRKCLGWQNEGEQPLRCVDLRGSRNNWQDTNIFDLAEHPTRRELFVTLPSCSLTGLHSTTFLDSKVITEGSEEIHSVDGTHDFTTGKY